jgi:DNA ligase-1
MRRKILDLIPLYSVEKNGKKRIWLARIESDGDVAYAIIEFGQEGGKMQTTVREYTKGKNIGKRNATTPLEQCTQETQRKWLDKKEKEGYNEYNEDASDVVDESKDTDDKIYPMLAQTYDPSKKSKIVYPCFVQPKLDGLRCIVYKTDNRIVFQSRTGGHFETMDHILPSLEPIFKKDPSVILDGELYSTDIPFEELAGLIKKKKISADDKERLKYVSYHIYDLAMEQLDFDERHNILSKLLNTPYRYLKLVPTYVANSVENFRERFSEFVAAGMEGIILRNKVGHYRRNYRSSDLQKYKEFFEEEFVIIGFKDGDGRDKGAVIWQCQNADKTSFWVRPRGTMEQRQEWFREADSYIGKMLTIIYQELSESNVPRFPVGKSIRDGF